jgi:hypothetical protein
VVFSFLLKVGGEMDYGEATREVGLRRLVGFVSEIHPSFQIDAIFHDAMHMRVAKVTGIYDLV